MASAKHSGMVCPDSALPRKQARYLLKPLLAGVSRSFYLSIRVLPPAVGRPVAVAYLLARAADSIADTEVVPRSDRATRLADFRRAIHLRDPALLEQVCGGAGERGVRFVKEQKLLAASADILRLLNSQPLPDQQHITEVVDILIGAMEQDLQYFAAAASGQVVGFRDEEQLDDYIYRIAGCVGAFWTRLLAAHCRPLRHWPVRRQIERGIRFGKALQLTNILRDVGQDLQLGRCYLPETSLRDHALAPENLLTGQRQRRLALRDRWLAQTAALFEDAEAYLLSLPRRCVRLRAAAFYPIAIGLKTLGLLSHDNDWPANPVPNKVDRRWVYQTLWRSAPVMGSNNALQRMLAQWRAQIHSPSGSGNLP